MRDVVGAGSLMGGRAAKRIMLREPGKKSDARPKCGDVIHVPTGCVGMFQTTCSACGARLVDYDGLYDEAGNQQCRK